MNTFIHILKNSFSNFPNVRTTIFGMVLCIKAENLSQLHKKSTTFFDFNLRSIVLYLPKKLVDELWAVFEILTNTSGHDAQRDEKH